MNHINQLYREQANSMSQQKSIMYRAKPIDSLMIEFAELVDALVGEELRMHAQTRVW